MLGVGTFPVKANNNVNIPDDGFYVETEPVPDEVVNYAVENVFDYLSAHSDGDDFDPYHVTMGKPFTMGHDNAGSTVVYYFPIFSGERFLYTFRVYKADGQYTGILSQYLAGYLNQYIGKTSQSEPLSIYLQDGNVMAKQGSIVEMWEERHVGYLSILADRKP